MSVIQNKLDDLKPSKLALTDLTFGLLSEFIRVHLQDYKSLRKAVMIYGILVSTDKLTAFDRLCYCLGTSQLR